MRWVPVVDVSQWQGAIDFKLMASRGVEGVIIRAGNGDAFDLRFASYVFSAKAAGLKVGFYWFVNPKVGTAVAAGRMLADVEDQWSAELPSMLDVESYALERGTGPAISGLPFGAWLRVMSDACMQHSTKRRRPIIYSSGSFWNSNVGDSSFGADHDLICARYPFYGHDICAQHVPPLDAAQWGDWMLHETQARPQLPVGWRDWGGWQFSAGFNGRARVYGASSADLDLNIIREDTYHRWLGTEPPPPPTPPTPPAIHPGDEEMLVFTTDNLGVHIIKGGKIMELSGPQLAVCRLLPIPSNEADASTYVDAAGLATLYELFV